MAKISREEIFHKIVEEFGYHCTCFYVSKGRIVMCGKTPNQLNHAFTGRDNRKGKPAYRNWVDEEINQQPVCQECHTETKRAEAPTNRNYSMRLQIVRYGGEELMSWVGRVPGKKAITVGKDIGRLAWNMTGTIKKLEHVHNMPIPDRIRLRNYLEFGEENGQE
jgi:hypothetical protein